MVAKQFYFLCALLCLVTAKKMPAHFVDTWNTMVAPFRRECAVDLDIDIETAKNLFATAHLINDRNYHCYARCIYTKLKMISLEGVFNPKVIVEKIPFFSKALIAKCIAATEDEYDTCTKSYIISKCIIKHVAVD
ncbi:hypothetical protein PPYR_08688 [Photinus pyralis]|uniref:Uncharacterized protein n=1 Tax=Photinus pyralis TaxID=7054 RepID=A0A1Y1L6X5_PHOPY|nr:uncharacterized protein LOC116171703 [Photinus pyralis]KAB0797695.1 hypothetical protein PPYR_08688 [Photinus pyralis]